jgi:hypothetical protein
MDIRILTDLWITLTIPLNNFDPRWKQIPITCSPAAKCIAIPSPASSTARGSLQQISQMTVIVRRGGTRQKESGVRSVRIYPSILGCILILRGAAAGVKTSNSNIHGRFLFPKKLQDFAVDEKTGAITLRRNHPWVNKGDKILSCAHVPYDQTTTFRSSQTRVTC